MYSSTCYPTTTPPGYWVLVASCNNPLPDRVYSYNPIGKRLISGELRWQLEEDTPEYPARIARDGHSGYPSTASGRCSRPGSSRVGEQTETGRWRIPQSVVHALLEQRREQERLRGGPESVRELMTRGRALEGVRALGGPSRT
jgi:hypothetical protein